MKPKHQRMILAVVAVLFSFATPSILTALGEYDLDYSVTNSGGGVSASASYNFVDSINVSGVEESSQSSSAYTVESVITEETPPTSVECWYLF